MTFSPLDNAVVMDLTINVTVTFDEAVRKAPDGDTFDDAAAVAAVTLVKVGDISNPGLAVSNRVTIDAEKQVITIDPANSLESGSRYTVTLRKNHVEDLPGNEITVDQTATFTVDADPPAVRYTPPPSLQVGVAITPMRPQTVDKDKNSHSYGATSLPDGLSIAGASTGEITGTPTTAGAAVTAAVTVTDAAGNSSPVSIKFPKVDKGEQTLSGFGYGAKSQNFDARPVLAAPAGAALGVPLVYATTTPEVCSVGETSGALTFLDAGDCTITVTAGGNTNYDEGEATFTVAVQPLGALALSVAPITGDNRINLAEKGAGFTISGETGTVTGAVVKVTIGTRDPPLTLPAESAKAPDAKQDDPAAWSVNVPLNSDHLTAGTVVVKVEASKAGYTAAPAVNRTLTVDLVAPVVTFAPVNNAVMTNPASDVTVSFNEAVRKANGATFDDAAAVAAVTLVKEGDNTDTDLAVSNRVTINAEKQVITINPANALESGSRYTVTLRKNHVEDLPGNRITVDQTATFTVDADPPAVTFAPADGDPAGPDVTVTVSFDEAVRNGNGSPITDLNAHAVVELKKGDSGSDLAVVNRVKVNRDKTAISIDPLNPLTTGSYTVRLLANAVEDRHGNLIGTEQTADFTVDADPPAVTFLPASGHTVGPNVSVTVTFDEAVRNINNNSAITDSNAHAVVELKKDDTGSDLAVVNQVTISGRVITINPASPLITGSYTVRVLENAVEDVHDNPLGTALAATFTVDADPPGVTFAPLDNAVVMDLTINVTVTFDEAVRKAPDGDVFDDAAAVAAVTLVKVGDISNPGLAVSNRVTIDAEKQVITIDPANSLESGSRYTVTLRKNHVEDLLGNRITVDQTATFTVDADPPAVRYTPPPSLQVGVAITPMRPQTVDKDKNSHSYGATSLPDGLSIADASTGEITGTPTAAGAAVTVTVTVTDAAGNSSPVSIKFPKVDKGEQTLSGFSYSASSLKLGATAPMVRPPAGAAARVPLVYATTLASASVCSVNSGTGELTILKVGQCVITATAAGNVNYDGGTISVTVTVQPVDNKIDYDADNDGLIEITKLEQLNAMRWDTDGNAAADVSSNDAAYAAAFPHPVAAAGGGNGALGCSDDSGAAAACTGYELKANLDFNEDASYANAPANKLGWTSGLGWEPVGTSSGGADWVSKRFRASFDGNGHAVANLFINRPSADHIGLFGMTHLSGALIRKVGLTDVNVTGRDEVGALAGRHYGTLRLCYASGRVTGRNDVGGLVGINGWSNTQGGIHGSFAAVAVSGGGSSRRAGRPALRGDGVGLLRRRRGLRQR